MNPEALIMLIVSIALVWGGLVAAAVNLFRRPDQSVGEDLPHTPSST
ncbi:methionine/alanine import family NSS transporter small subunit [Tessaracoccus sp.]